ncbi:ThuA domain-containing protein [Nocardioides sp.]|uniref:ThuA domain-containing protein n=1 Tax=Nocardioides sp. TaxID=35761 RepID=UPI00351859D6
MTRSRTQAPGLDRRRLLAGGLVGGAAGAVGPLLLPGAARAAGARPRLLVFTRTTGFRHSSIPVAIATISRLGDAHGFDVVATEDPERFSTTGLARHDAVAFVNTTGDVLDARQRRALEAFVTGGGGWAGVHSAADSEYTSAFHTRLLAGGRFLCHPLEQPGVVVREAASHRSTSHLPARWLIPVEEFYSFTSSVRGRSRVLLSIDESTYLQDPNTSDLPSGPALPEGRVSGVMGDHPMSWQHRVGRGLSWYTALGHEVTMYLDPLFRRHLLGGLRTVLAHGRVHRR